MDKKVAIVDLGSNTFHLLIAQITGGNQIEEIYRQRYFVGLSEGGVKEIKPEKISLGLDCCKKFADVISMHQVDGLKVVGTAVLRTATNANSFVTPCEEIFGCKIEIISGSREAELIFKGVQMTGISLQSAIIMDIGGGSVEFIIVKNGNIKFSESFQIGVGVLHDLFHKTEPIGQLDYQNCKGFVAKAIKEVVTNCGSDTNISLIGASGSFEVVRDVYGDRHKDLDEFEIDRESVAELCNTIIAADYETRAAIKGIPIERVKLIVVAMILIEVVLEKIKPRKLVFSPYAIKEGLISEMV